MTEQDIVHMLSFDVEEYFHVEAAADIDATQFPSRLESDVDRVLDLLTGFDVSATFFVLGKVAETEPVLIRRIAQAGHEIASHGMSHTMISRLTPDQFRQEAATSKTMLEDLVGQEVTGYRAPTFSITRQTAWALDILADVGFRYDSSIFPIRHDRYGVPGAPADVHIAVGPGGGRIYEIPPLTRRVLGMNFPVGGGGYLRLLPVHITARVLRHTRRPGMIYLHPWELDANQPVMPMGMFKRWRHRVGLGRTESKLRYLLENFSFSSVDRLWPTLTEHSAEKFDYSEGLL